MLILVCWYNTDMHWTFDQIFGSAVKKNLLTHKQLNEQIIFVSHFTGQNIFGGQFCEQIIFYEKNIPPPPPTHTPHLVLNGRPLT